MKNRVIKFRAWDDYTKEMYYDVSYSEEQEGGVRPWIFMQYTGLADKNGKDIYEGDVVKHDKENSATDKMLFEIKYGKYPCPFGEGYVNDVEFGFFAESFELAYIRSIAASDKLEVVGNIYEK